MFQAADNIRKNPVHKKPHSTEFFHSYKKPDFLLLSCQCIIGKNLPATGYTDSQTFFQNSVRILRFLCMCQENPFVFSILAHLIQIWSRRNPSVCLDFNGSPGFQCFPDLSFFERKPLTLFCQFFNSVIFHCSYIFRYFPDKNNMTASLGKSFKCFYRIRSQCQAVGYQHNFILHSADSKAIGILMIDFLQ